MNVINDNRIFGRYNNGFKRTKTIDKIILHGTGGGESADALFKWILSDNFERVTAYRGGEGFPFLLDRNGDIYQLSDYKKIFQYHAGIGQADQYTIGIELVNPDGGNNMPYEDEQYDALFELILDLMSDVPTIKHIYGHGQIQKEITGKDKNCPGQFFDWKRLETFLTDNGFIFDRGTRSIKNITTA